MLEQRRHEGRARNVILFVGDGMGIQTHTMARIFKVTRGMLDMGTDNYVVLQKVPSEGSYSWLKAATTAFTFKTLLRHYAKRALTPWALNVKLGPRRNYHEGRAAIRHYANQPARPL